MKRSTESPVRGGASKRIFDNMGASHRQRQYHQQMQHRQITPHINNNNNHYNHQQHRQQQRHIQNHQHRQQQLHHHQQQQQYFTRVSNSPPRMSGMMPFGCAGPLPPPLRQSSYMFNHSPRIWNINIPPPPPTNIRPPATSPVRPPPLPLSQPRTQLAFHPAPMLPPPSLTDIDLASARISSWSTPPPPANYVVASEDEESRTVVSKKLKRKCMSSRYGCPKDWVLQDALKAVALEDEYSRKGTKTPVLLLRFPDPELSRDIISKYSPDIESVHFQQNFAPRYCFVHLKDGADAEKIIETVSKIPFGTGFVSAEIKRISDPATTSATSSNPDEVDPYTLYIGNLPTTISSRTVKEHFPGAQRIDIGFAQRMKYTRYAFVRYVNVDEAIEAYRRAVNTQIENRSLIVRFRRQRSNVAGESTTKKDAVAANEDLDVSNGDISDKTTNEANSTTTSTIETTTTNASAIDTTLTGTHDPITVKSNEYSKDVLLPKSSESQLNNVEAMPTVVDTNKSTELDLPTSTKNQEMQHTDCKENVLNDMVKCRSNLDEVAQTQRTAHQPREHLRRSSLEEMFGELDRRNTRLTDISTGTNNVVEPLMPVASIKEEDRDDDISDDEVPSNNLLGFRYREDTQIKSEPEEIPITNNVPHKSINHEDYEYHDEFDTESEDEEYKNVTKTDTLLTQNLTSNTPFNNHSSFMEQLHEEVRRTKESEYSKRPRDDELDKMFAQMNSEEEDDDLF